MSAVSPGNFDRDRLSAFREMVTDIFRLRMDNPERRVQEIYLAATSNGGCLEKLLPDYKAALLRYAQFQPEQLCALIKLVRETAKKVFLLQEEIINRGTFREAELRLSDESLGELQRAASCLSLLAPLCSATGLSGRKETALKASSRAEKAAYITNLFVLSTQIDRVTNAFNSRHQSPPSESAPTTPLTTLPALKETLRGALPALEAVRVHCDRYKNDQSREMLNRVDNVIQAAKRAIQN